MLPVRVHILGASGSGTTTLAVALARQLECVHFDVDSFFWMPTEPPFQGIREREQRIRLLGQALTSSPSWILSGSLCGWGDGFIRHFSLVVFLWLPAEVRIRRLIAREGMRYGKSKIAEGGPMRRQHREFIDWAAAYDEGDLGMRSLRLHNAWLDALTCPVIRLESELPTDDQVTILSRRLAQLRGPGHAAQ